jgi:hypothetical protein
MNNEDWQQLDRYDQERLFSQQLKIKDNVIKDLRVQTTFYERTVDNLLRENYELRKELEQARLSSVTYLPDIPEGWTSPNLAAKIHELRKAGEQLTKDIAKLKESMKPFKQ